MCKDILYCNAIYYEGMSESIKGSVVEDWLSMVYSHARILCGQ